MYSDYTTTEVVVGLSSLSDPSLGSPQVREVVGKQVLHPGYNRSVNANHDLMLYKIKAVTYKHLKPIEINFNEMYPEDGTTVRYIGFGTTDPEDEGSTSVPEKLQSVDVQLQNAEECEDLFDYVIDELAVEEGIDVSFLKFFPETMICTLTPGKDACKGDSGGPLVDSTLR